MHNILEKPFGAEPEGWIYKEWRQIGTLESGVDVYRNTKTGRLGVEREFTYLVDPSKAEKAEIKLY